MGWLAIRGEALCLAGEAGEAALTAFGAAIDAYQAAGDATGWDLATAREKIETALAAADLQAVEGVEAWLDLLSGQHALGETLIWLSKPVSTTAGSGEAASKRYDLLGWTPKNDIDIGSETLALNFEAAAWLELAAVEENDAVFVHAELSGAVGGKAALSSTDLPSVLDKASFAFEWKAGRAIAYRRRAASEDERGDLAFCALFKAMKASPFDLEGVGSALGDGGLSGITLTTTASDTFNAGLNVDIPLAIDQVITSGGMTFSFDIDQAASLSLVSTISLSDNPVVTLSATNAWSNAVTVSNALGLKVTLALGDVFKAVSDQLDAVDDLAKSVIREMGELADLKATITESVKSALAELISDADAAEALSASLFDKDAQEGLLADYLIGKLKKPAGLWMKEVAAKARSEALDGLDDAGWAQIQIGAHSVHSLAAGALDKVIAMVTERIDAGLDEIVDGTLGGSFDNAQSALGQIGKAMDESIVLTSIEDASKTLRTALDKMTGRIGKLKKALEAAAETTLALNFTSVTTHETARSEEFSIDFDPASPAARAVYADAMRAPRSVVAALMDAETEIAGVEVLHYTAASRRRHALRQSLSLALFGVDMLEHARTLSSETRIIQNCSEVVLAGAADADATLRFGLTGEIQSVSASYLYRDPEPADPDTLSAFDKSLAELAEASDAFRTPLALTITQQDTKNLEAGEVTELLGNFTDDEIGQPVRDAFAAAALGARGADGKLKATLGFCLKLNNGQIDALVAAGAAANAETEITRAFVDAFWSVYEAQKGDVAEIRAGLDVIKKSTAATKPRYADAVAAYTAEQLKTLTSQTTGKARLGLRKIKDTRAAVEGYLGFIDTCKQMRESLASITEGSSAADREAAIAHREKLVHRMKKKLAPFARAGGVAAEHVHVGPLALVRVIRSQFLLPPDLVVSFKPTDTEEVKLFSNAIHA